MTGRGHIDDLTGRRFGRLIVVSRAENRKGLTFWNCTCDCGNHVTVRASHLKDGGTKSCGCLNNELCSHIASTYRPGLKHGGKGERLYRVWKNMRNRCNNPMAKKYRIYGGRGITVCDEWDDYAAFRSWAIENGYQEGLQIDRIDNDGKYSPDNCRWVTNKVNSNNRGNNHILTVNGISHTLSEWSDITGINRSTLYARVIYGVDEQRILLKEDLRNGRKFVNVK